MSAPQGQPSDLGKGPFITDEQRGEIVHSFMLAFLDGKAEVQYPNDVTIIDKTIREDVEKVTGESLAGKNSQATASVWKRYFTKSFRICAGSIVASTDEIKIATNQVFNTIIAFRVMGCLQGQFLGIATVESKLTDIENTLSRHESLLRELQMLMRLLGENIPQH